jgi:hypothetical protein
MPLMLGKPFVVRTKVIVLALAFVALTASAATAGGSLDKSSVAANADVAVTLNVAVDKLPASNERVLLEVPGGFRVLACPNSDTFNCTQSTADKPPRTVLTWRRTTPGAPVPLDADHFPFRLHTIDKPGSYVFAAHQTYSDGTSADWAAKLAVTAAPARAVTTTTVKVAAPVVRSAAATATHRPAPVTPVTDPAWLTDTDYADAPPIELGHESRVKQSAPMLAAGVVAAVAACGVFWLRRRAAAEA